MFYVYILQSERNGSYYIGSCKDLKKRVDLHNHGLVRSTKRYVSWKLVYHELHRSLKDARQREKQIKSWKQRNALKKLIKHAK